MPTWPVLSPTGPPSGRPSPEPSTPLVMKVPFTAFNAANGTFMTFDPAPLTTVKRAGRRGQARRFCRAWPGEWWGCLSFLARRADGVGAWAGSGGWGGSDGHSAMAGCAFGGLRMSGLTAISQPGGRSADHGGSRMRPRPRSSPTVDHAVIAFVIMTRQAGSRCAAAGCGRSAPAQVARFSTAPAPETTPREPLDRARLWWCAT